MKLPRRGRRPAVAAGRDLPSAPVPFFHRVIPGAALVALAFAVYANAFTAGFALDGRGLVLQDPRVRAATAENVALIRDHTYWWPYGESGLYRPVTTLSYLVNYAGLGHGERAAGYHATNVLLHAMNVLLLFALARRIPTDTRIAWFVAAVWAVHPILTEVVANVAGRADLLAAACVLAGILCYDNSRLATGARRGAWLLGLALAALIGTLSKENAIVIVAAIGLFELTRGRDARSVRHLMRATIVLAVPLLVVVAQRSAVLTAAGAAPIPFTDNPITSGSFLSGRATALAVIGRYLWLLAWPATLSADYSYAAVPVPAGSPTDWLAWATLALAVLLAVVASRRSRAVLFWILFAVAALLPTANLFLTIGSIMAERFLYLPAAGVVACAVLGAFSLGRGVGLAGSAPIVLGLAIALLGVRTVGRNADWQDDLTLATATVQAVPSSAKAHRMLAAALYGADPSHSRIDEAIAEATRAIAIVESLPDAKSDGELYLEAGGYLVEQGERSWRTAPDGGPTVRPAERGPYARAIPLLRRAAAIGEAQRDAAGAQGFAPHYATVHTRLSTSLLRVGDLSGARDAARRAQRIAPLDPQGHARQADALLASNRPDDAAVALTMGLMLTNDDRLGRALVALYRAGLDTDGCAVRGAGTASGLNPQCPVVRRHVCAATGEAVGLLASSGASGALAERLRATAVERFGCTAAAPDRASRGEFDETRPGR
jgi:hypothetical protein